MIKNYVAVDLETTGLNPKYNKIIEIGGVKVIDNKIVDTYSSFVKPDQKLSQIIIDLTGITEEMLSGNDVKEPGEALEEFLNFMEDFPLLGHNLNFDYAFLKKYFVDYEIKFEKWGVDTLKIARKYLTSLEHKSLGDICSYYGICNERAHRALGDAKAAHEVYQCLLKDFFIEKEERDENVQKDFAPQPLIYRMRKEAPATEKQKQYLLKLMKIYKIDITHDIEKKTKSEASRYINYIVSHHGK